MANTKTNKTATKKATKTNATAKPKPVAKKDVAPQPVIETQPIEEKREFKSDTPIPCSSIFPGELLMTGIRSNMPYRWVSYGDTVDVEYQDLIASIRTGATNSVVLKPYIIILDEDFVEQNPAIKTLYSSMYQNGDLQDIIDLTPNGIKSVVPTLPSGAKESLKNIATTSIMQGSLDSINKIKALDEVLGTQLILLVDIFGA